MDQVRSRTCRRQYVYASAAAVLTGAAAVVVTQAVAQGSPDTGTGRRPAASSTPAGGTWISMKGGRLDFDTAFTRR
ncbi:hypothetical protein AOB60_21185 [Streptomyces noursei]|uniref:Uncharacterized protein n=1 Tax=Streptomyces noursei TaxID=1971 RepID=A0A2N8P7K2_STRNR|nr:hypothetical protein AOB60_21185 [Streptomyces noursei]